MDPDAALHAEFVAALESHERYAAMQFTAVKTLLVFLLVTVPLNLFSDRVEELVAVPVKAISVLSLLVGLLLGNLGLSIVSQAWFRNQVNMLRHERIHLGERVDEGEFHRLMMLRARDRTAFRGPGSALGSLTARFAGLSRDTLVLRTYYGLAVLLSAWVFFLVATGARAFLGELAAPAGLAVAAANFVAQRSYLRYVIRDELPPEAHELLADYGFFGDARRYRFAKEVAAGPQPTGPAEPAGLADGDVRS